MLFSNTIDKIIAGFYHIVIWLVGGIYQIVNYTYQIFLFLAETNLFDESTYHSITDKIYVILGVVVLFIFAYNFLTYVVDPDKTEKGASIEKLLKNMVISFILIVIMPSIFNFAINVQNAILTTNGGVITNVFQDAIDENEAGDTIRAGGRAMAVNTFKAFFTPAEDDTNYGIKSKSRGRKYELKDGTEVNCKSGCTLNDADKVAKQLGKFSVYQAFAMNIVDDEIEFNWIVALIAGGYLCYVIISFCFDLAVRACKLAMYQIIAPITIACRILPKQEDIFQKWVKATWKTYVSLFIRIFAMNLGVFLVSVFIDSDFFASCDECSFGVQLLGYAFVIMGIVTFIKQAPKLIDDIFGLNDDISLGIKEKLKAGGAYRALSMAGGGASSLASNITHTVQNYKRAKTPGQQAEAVVKGVGSSLIGGLMGAGRGFKNSANAGNMGDVKNAAHQARQTTEENRDKHENALSAHSRGKGLVDDVYQASKAYVADKGKGVAAWAGVKNVDQLKEDNKAMDEIKSSRDNFDTTAENFILKEISKNKDDIDLGNGVKVDLTAVKRAKQELDNKRVRGTATAADEAYYKGILKNAMYQVQERAGLSNEHWNAIDEKAKANLSELRVAAVNYKGAVRNNSALDALVEAGIKGSDYADNQDLILTARTVDAQGIEHLVVEDIKDDAGRVVGQRVKENTTLDAMNQNMKLHHGENDIVIAQKKQDESDDKKK